MCLVPVTSRSFYLNQPNAPLVLQRSAEFSELPAPLCQKFHALMKRIHLSACYKTPAMPELELRQTGINKIVFANDVAGNFKGEIRNEKNPTKRLKYVCHNVRKFMNSNNGFIPSHIIVLPNGNLMGGLPLKFETLGNYGTLRISMFGNFLTREELGKLKKEVSEQELSLKKILNLSIENLKKLEEEEIKLEGTLCRLMQNPSPSLKEMDHFMKTQNQLDYLWMRLHYSFTKTPNYASIKERSQKNFQLREKLQTGLTLQEIKDFLKSCAKLNFSRKEQISFLKKAISIALEEQKNKIKFYTLLKSKLSSKDYYYGPTPQQLDAACDIINTAFELFGLNMSNLEFSTTPGEQPGGHLYQEGFKEVLEIWRQRNSYSTEKLKYTQV